MQGSGNRVRGMMRVPFLAALGLICAPAARAHPHIFVDTHVEVVFDEGRLASVRMEWVYDELFSLLLAEDMGLDDDADGEMTAEEEALLSERVTGWPPGYNGALHVFQEGQEARIGPPQEHVARYSEGRMHEHLVREVAGPLDPADPVEIAIYEAEFYTAYDLFDPIMLVGEGADMCSAEIRRADIRAAQKEVEEMIGRLPQDVGAEEAFPPVGDRFADRIVIRCDG